MAVNAFGDPNKTLHECENCQDRGWVTGEAGQFFLCWMVCGICANRRDRPAPRDGTPIFIRPPRSGAASSA